MNIMVCLKLVSQMQFADSLGVSSTRLTGGKLVMNPADQYALELALRLKDEDPAVHVSVITMASRKAERMLREALAMGAEDAVCISDQQLAGSDTIVTARVLSRALNYLGFSGLILCGNKAIDSETGHIGPQIAANLSIPVLTNAISFKGNGPDGLLVDRLQDNGTVTLSCHLPLVMSVCRGVKMVRLPLLSAYRSAQQKNIRYLDAHELGLDSKTIGSSGSLTREKRISGITYRKRKEEEIPFSRKGMAFLRSLLERGGR